MKRSKTISLLTLAMAFVVLLVFPSCPGQANQQFPPVTPPPITGDEGPDASDLVGQWEVRLEGQPVIDIQYTKPGYWTYAFYVDEMGGYVGSGWFPSSDRKESADGWYSMKVEYSGDELEIQYRFLNGDKDTLECKYITESSSIDVILTRLETPVEITVYETA